MPKIHIDLNEYSNLQIQKYAKKDALKQINKPMESDLFNTVDRIKIDTTNMKYNRGAGPKSLLSDIF
jgi:hypothetical protein